MSTHPTEEDFARYHWRAMSPAELLALDDHLASCEVCRRRLGEIEQTRSVYNSLRETLREAVYDSEVPGSRHQFAARRPPRWAIASGVLLLILATAWFIRQARRPPPISNVEAGQPSPDLESSMPPRTEQPDRPAQYNASPSQTPTPDEDVPDATVPRGNEALALNDGGGSVTLNTEGNIGGLEGLPGDLQRAVKKALSTQRAQVSPALDSLNGRRETLLGDSGPRVSLSLLSPLGIILNTTRPTFRWRALDGATPYVVSVYDADFNLVASSPKLSETVWKPDISLKRGATYSWQVSATKDGREIIAPAAPAPQAMFKVLDEAGAARLESARRAYADSHLLLGVLYAREGLLAEAEREFRLLLRANPGSPASLNLGRLHARWHHPRPSSSDRAAGACPERQGYAQGGNDA